ncbi:MAG: hypothetical protein JNK58_13375 [Phycisphaerae bacterium]|nr:hypothetical protein [Phycisphaerae bacterium]
MRVLLSPYEIGSASPAAAAAMLLARDDAGVLAVQPSPFESGGGERARELSMEAPSFGRLIEAQRWAGPLWRGGLIRAAETGRALAEMIETSRAELRADPSLSPVRNVIANREPENEASFIESLSRDLLRGGSDPAVSLPLVSVTERLAARAEAALVCGEAAGMIWKPRVGSGAGLSFSIPVPIGANGAALLEWRDALAKPLSVLRESLGGAVRLALGGRLNGQATAVRLAAESFARDFAACHLERSQRLDGRPSEVTISLAISSTGQAVRDAVARLARLAPARRPVGDDLIEGGLAARGRPLALLRVRPSAWDFGSR